MNLGAPELLVIFVISLVFLGLVIWAVVDAAGRPAEAFEAAGSNRTLWIALPIIALVVCGFGWLVAAVYLIAIRPKVAAAQQS